MASPIIDTKLKYTDPESGQMYTIDEYLNSNLDNILIVDGKKISFAKISTLCELLLDSRKIMWLYECSSVGNYDYDNPVVEISVHKSNYNVFMIQLQSLLDTIGEWNYIMLKKNKNPSYLVPTLRTKYRPSCLYDKIKFVQNTFNMIPQNITGYPKRQNIYSKSRYDKINKNEMFEIEEYLSSNRQNMQKLQKYEKKIYEEDEIDYMKKLQKQLQDRQTFQINEQKQRNKKQSDQRYEQQQMEQLVRQQVDQFNLSYKPKPLDDEETRELNRLIRQFNEKPF